MAWQTPKTNWQAGDIPGPGDFNRSEGNSEYLRGQINELKIYVIPSDTIILQSTGSRSRQGHEWLTVKKLRLKYEGIYRVKLDIRSSSTSSTARASIYVEQNAGADGGIIVSTISAASGVSRQHELYVPAGGIVAISINNSNNSNYTYVGNVRVCGTLMTRSDVGNNAVLQD